MEEVWKDIKDYPGYQVSNMGRVRTYNKYTSNRRYHTRHWDNRIIKQKVSRKDKTARVELWRNGNHKTVLVCRLVANEFIAPLMDTEMTVNHKDGNRLNNNVENLEWLTRADNIRHGFKTGLYPTNRCSLVGVDGYRHEFLSYSEASRFLGRSEGYVSQCIRKGRNITDTNGFSYSCFY